jgi:hypothetical protein
MNKRWFLRRSYRRFRHFVGRQLHEFADNRALGLFLPPAVGLYFLTLDIWGDKLPWITDHIGLHEKIFFGLVAFSLLALFARSFASTAKIQNDGDANILLNDFITAVGVIVTVKTDRLRRSMSRLRRNMEKFRVVSVPEEQIATVATTAAGFICKAFGLHEDSFDLTIVRSKAGSESWHYIFEHKKWKHTDPNELLKQRSAAFACLERREPLFLPDKFASAHGELCVLSDRDRRRGPGSLFVYPALFDTPRGMERYLISLVTYGGQLCDEWDETSIKVTQCFLKEFCRRLELELSHYTLQKY